VILVLLASLVADVFRDREEKERKAAEKLAPPKEFDAMAGGFPVPPLPGQTPQPVPRRRSRLERELIVSGAVNTDSDGKEADDA
jgi:NADH-quinone oxidoreductase subunit H